ncbi:hypothetical protein [Caballeronia insecticola]|uniref:hypothetical protein n=1 Tax=Caballeronia insecticola TaxID=758793 RepID=UPI00118391A8|nr:hypothetical protein [Caballeronia insecticola]
MSANSFDELNSAPPPTLLQPTLQNDWRIKMRKTARIPFRASWVAVALVVACPALAQERPSVAAASPGSVPIIGVAPAIAPADVTPSANAAPASMPHHWRFVMPRRSIATADLTPFRIAAQVRMLHHWHRATSIPQENQSLNQLLARRPDLQTHSHMTYTTQVRVGERTRLQLPGSEFAH